MQDLAQLAPVWGQSGTSAATTQVFGQPATRIKSEPARLPVSARQAQGRLANQLLALEQSARDRREEVRRGLASVESFVHFLADTARQFRLELALGACRLVAELFEDAGRFGAAIVWLRKAEHKLGVRQLDDKAKIEAAIGGCLARQGELVKAAGYLRRSLKRLHSYPPVHNNLGATYIQLGKPNDALPPLEQALHLDPKYAPAALNKALALQKLERKQDALDILNDLVRLDSTYDCDAEVRARALALLDRADEAIDTLETEARRALANFSMLLMLARWCNAQGRLHASLGWFERALHINRDSEVLKEYEDIRARVDRESKLTDYIGTAEVEVPVGIAVDDWSELSGFLEGQT